MIKFKSSVFYILMLLITALLISCGEGSSSGSDDPNDDTDPPVTPEITDPVVLNVNFADSSIISNSQTISITFSKSMDLSTLSISGEISADSYNTSWSMTYISQDTLNISPSTYWTTGDNLSLIIDCNDIEGGVLETLSLSYDIIDIPIIIDINQPDNSLIPTNQDLVIQFSKIMDTATLSITGDLALESDGGSWSDTTNTNDTLTIVPAASWTEGPDKTLILECDDTEGNAIDTYSLTYDVLDNKIYVSTAGEDSNFGAKDSPLRNIYTAVAKVKSLFGTGSIHVAEGSYTERVNINANISLYGGYSSSDWEVRDPETYVTEIIDAEYASGTDSSRLVYFDGFILLANIEISASYGEYHILNNTCEYITSSSGTAISVKNIIATNNIITETTSDYNGAFFIDSYTNATIDSNTINHYRGLFISNIQHSEITVSNNIINITRDDTYNAGIYTYSSNTMYDNNIFNIENNTINMIDTGINFRGGGEINISGNTITTTGDTADAVEGILIRTLTSGNSINITNNTILPTYELGTYSNGIYHYYDSETNSLLITDNNIYHGVLLYNVNVIIDDNVIYNPAYVTGEGACIIIEDCYNQCQISNNILNSYDGPLADTSAIKLSSVSNIEIFNNSITCRYHGIEIRNTYMIIPHYYIINNTILAYNPDGGASFISLMNGIEPVIENNIFYAVTAFGDNVYGVYEAAGNQNYHPEILSMKNNYLACSTYLRDMWYNYNTSSLTWTNYNTLADLHDIGSAFNGNLNGSTPLFFVDPDGTDNDYTTFIDNDYHLSGTSDTAVTEGGNDWSSIFTTDIDGNTRTAPWSIGAYEFD